MPGASADVHNIDCPVAAVRIGKAGSLVSRSVQIVIPAFEVQVRARLLTDRAPATCQAIWEQLEEPLEIAGTHAMWTGPEISMQIPPEAAVPGLSRIPAENQTVFPQPGALVWAYLPPRVWAGMPGPLYDLGLFYAPQGRIFLPIGWVPCNHFAQLEGDSEKFQEACRRFLTEGRQQLVFRRNGGQG
jgi:hypothetical protein